MWQKEIIKFIPDECSAIILIQVRLVNPISVKSDKTVQIVIPQLSCSEEAVIKSA